MQVKTELEQPLSTVGLVLLLLVLHSYCWSYIIVGLTLLLLVLHSYCWSYIIVGLTFLLLVLHSYCWSYILTVGLTLLLLVSQFTLPNSKYGCYFETTWHN